MVIQPGIQVLIFDTLNSVPIINTILRTIGITYYSNELVNGASATGKGLLSYFPN